MGSCLEGCLKTVSKGFVFKVFLETEEEVVDLVWIRSCSSMAKATVSVGREKD